MMAKNAGQKLTEELMTMKDKVRGRKMSESTFRRKAKILLETHTGNPSSQNRKVINDLLKVAKAERALFDSFDSLGGR